MFLRTEEALNCLTRAVIRYSDIFFEYRQFEVRVYTIKNLHVAFHVVGTEDLMFPS